MTVSIDTRDLDVLDWVLGTAAEGAPRESEAALTKAVERVHAQAVSNAAKVRDTGALMESVDYDTEGMTRRVWSETREAWFQESGSPTTGAPNPWLTGPARAAVPELLRDIERVGSLW